MAGTTVPGSPDPIDKTASTAKETTDKVADEAKGLRARYRAIRSDEDVQRLSGEAKPFAAGVALVGGLMVDPPVTLALATLQVGRAVQRRRHRNEPKATESTTPSA